ncbi:MAG: hypothetical protein ABIH48_01855 [Candidatus Falkowbacteria bacterium]
MTGFLKNKIIIFILLGLLIIPFFVNAARLAPEVNAEDLPNAQSVKNSAAEQVVNLYFFYSETCPRCHEEALFLSKLQQEYADKVKIYAFEVTTNRANLELFKKFGQQFEVDISSVPLLFIGERYIIGYQNDEYTGAEIQNLVEQYLKLGYHDLGRHVLFPDEECDYEKQEPCPDDTSKIIKVPLIGEINLQNTSLFIATIVLGGLDGFNPCAMWVLIFLISLLLGIESVKRRWILGITFIAGSALVYYLFMAAWLNIFLFIGYLLIVRIIIGGLAIVFGIYNLKKYIKDRAGTCEVTNTESRQKVMQKLKDITLNSNLVLAMLGIILLAFTVNLIELACSAGFPAIYTSILASQGISKASYYLYLLLYIIIFMLDDMIVFSVAMVTLRLTGVDSKYAKYSNLIGGIIILILGVLLIFKPSLLMFG